MPVGPDDLDDAPVRQQAGGNLRNAGILGAGNGIDLFQQCDLLLERDEVERAKVGIEMAVGPLGRRGERAGGRIEQLQCFARAADGGRADLVCVSKAGGLTRYPAQAEARIAGIICSFQPAVVETEGFGCDELHVELAIIAGRQKLLRQRLRLFGRELVSVYE